jgi:serine/threonine-protein kinase
LKKLSLLSGASQTICPARVGGNACWLEDDRIVFGDSRQFGLWQVPAGGGTPEQLTTALKFATRLRELSHLHPHALPRGKGLLFTILNAGGPDNIATFSFQTTTYIPCLEGGTQPHYLQAGYLVYLDADKLVAAPFDLHAVRVTGRPVPIVEEVMSGQFSVSRNGSLAYVPGDRAHQAKRGPVRVDRAGKAEALPRFPDGRYQSPRISPDGEQLLIVLYDRLPNLWLYGLAKGSQRRFTDDRGTAWWGIWSPDGKEIVFNSDLGGPIVSLYSKPVEGNLPERRLTTDRQHLILSPKCWADGGKTVIALAGYNTNTWFDIVRLPQLGPGFPEPVLTTPFSEINPDVSPDGRYLAYESDASGRHEVYLNPYPGPGREVPVTTDGGKAPVWDPSGKALYYRDETGHKLYRVPVVTEPAIQVGSAELLFEGGFKADSPWGRNYDISPKGDFFIMIQEEPPQPATQINVVLNWSEELKRLSAARK